MVDKEFFIFCHGLNCIDTNIEHDLNQLVSICQYIANQLGVQLKVVDMNFDNLVMGLKNGDFDIVSACMSADDKRRESIDFTDIVYNTDTVLVTKDGYELLTRYPADLEHLIVRRQNWIAAIKGALIRKAIRF